MTQFWRDKRVVVGGGCGFLGSYLVPPIVAAGARVTVVDNLDNSAYAGASAYAEATADKSADKGAREALGDVLDRIRFVEADLRERRVCDEALRACDLFVNLAAKASGVGFSRTHHGEMLVDNLLTGLVPLQAAARREVPHVVLISTSCVYPDDAPVPTPELDPFVGSPESVNEGYGWAKRMQELAGGYFARERGMQVTILRPFNLYGANYPWRSTEKAHVIPALVKRVLDGEDPLVVWGSGEQRRNFLHGSDAADVVMRVIERAPAEPVNIGYEDDTSIAELVSLICDVTGRHPAIEFDRSRPDGAARKSADATRLRSLTGNYEPRVTLRQGIEEMVRWYGERFGESARPVRS
jgi:nucleoside-diphosphate-sugar epimerase